MYEIREYELLYGDKEQIVCEYARGRLSLALGDEEVVPRLGDLEALCPDLFLVVEIIKKCVVN